MAGGLAGLAFGGGIGNGLQKLRIGYKTHLGVQKWVEALFNPAEISRSRRVKWDERLRWQSGTNWSWRNSERQFVAVEPETLSLTMFFDTYEAHVSAGSSQLISSVVSAANPFSRSQASDVRNLTRQVAALAAVDRELHHPPVCQLSWGTQEDIFTGVLTQLDQNFTMFLPDGTPVRATLSCSFDEFQTEAHAKAREVHSSDVVKTRVARRGDSLQSLAAQEYRDPSLWREIARANGIINPRSLSPGQILTIPKLSG
jgi:hypothetical protein